MGVLLRVLVQKGRKPERPVPKRPHQKGRKPKRPQALTLGLIHLYIKGDGESKML